VLFRSGDAPAGGDAAAPAPDAAGETEAGFFAEMVGDLLRLDFRTVLAAVFIVLSLLFALFGATGSTLVNVVFLCLPVMTSWLFHNGWVSWTEGDRPKIMFLAFVAGVLCLVGILHLSSFAAGAASL